VRSGKANGHQNRVPLVFPDLAPAATARSAAPRTRRVRLFVLGSAIHGESAFIREIRGVSFFAAVGLSAGSEIVT